MVNQKYFNLLSSLKPKNEIVDLFKLIVGEEISNSRAQTLTKINRLTKRISNVQSKLNHLTDKFVEDLIDHETFSLAKHRYSSELNALKTECALIDSDKAVDKLKIEACSSLLMNLDRAFSYASLELKQSIHSSIFSDKLVFDGKEYRTP